MALTPCKECGKKVSTLAKTCPSCGISDPGVKESNRFAHLSGKRQTKYISEKRQTRSSSSTENLFADFWEGNIPLVKSYWLGGVVALIVAGLPLLYATINIDSISESAASLLLLYYFAYLIFSVYIFIGVWRSSDKYISLKQKHGESSLWGFAAKVMVVLGALRSLLDVIKVFQ